MPRKITVTPFDDIGRGESLTIPVLIHRADGTPFDLSGYQVFFTLKAEQFDHDYDDERALIAKEIPVADLNAVKGRINITLSSKETWLHPGPYIWDVELVKDHGVSRICMCRSQVVGGPTNRTVDHKEGYSINMTEAVDITLDYPNVIVVQTPLVSDPPENLVETIEPDPPYIYQPIDDEPHRHFQMQVYGPRCSFMMNIHVPHDALEHRYRFDNYFKDRTLPNGHPLKNAVLCLRNRDIHIEMADGRKMWMDVADMYLQHNPELTYNGAYVDHWTTDDTFVVGDRVIVGQLRIQLEDKNDQVDISGSYMLWDDHGNFSNFMLRVDWFNWVDVFTE